MIVDSDLIIFGIQRRMPVVRLFLDTHLPTPSAASEVEVLGHHNMDPADLPELEAFFVRHGSHPITPAVVAKAVELRQQRKLGLGDAFIAGTALVLGVPLATNNIADFQWIKGLVLVNPLTGP